MTPTPPVAPPAPPAVPPVAPPAVPPPATSLSSKLDTLFEEITPKTVPTEPTVEPPVAEPPVEPLAPEPEDPDDTTALEEAMAKEGEPPKPNWLDLNTPRGQRIYREGYKVVRAVEDGLGFKPSAEDIQAWYARQAQVDAMETDFTSSDPADVQNFIAQWYSRSPEGMQRLVMALPEFLGQAFASGNDETARQSLVQMASRLPEFLGKVYTATKDPTAYNSLALPVLSRYEGTLYQRAEEAQRSGNQELANSLWHAGNVLEWDRTGKFRASPWNGGPAAPPAAEPDRSSEERAELDRQWRQINEHRQQQTVTSQRAFIDGTLEAVHTSVMSRVDEALKPIKDSQPPELYEMFRDRLLQQVQTSVPKVARFSEYRNAFDRAVRAPSDEARANLVNLYASMATGVIQTHRTKLLKLASEDLSARSAQAHAQHARASSQVSPGTGAAPPPSTQPVAPGLVGEERRKVLLDQILG